MNPNPGQRSKLKPLPRKSKSCNTQISEREIIFKPNIHWCFDPFVYKIFYGATGVEQPIVQEVCAERGWKEYSAEVKKLTYAGAIGWNLWWRCSTLPVAAANRTLYSWQFTNQLPKPIAFCNKQYLRYYLDQLETAFGIVHELGPKTYILPVEWELLVQENDVRLQIGANGTEADILKNKNLVQIKDKVTGKYKFTPIWITKPVGKSQGKGITIIDDIRPLAAFHANTVVQEYIARPLLIGGHKWDLRIYVCVTCTNPLTMYVYREGLTRFATQQYDLNDLSNSFSHLTNASLNKFSASYLTNKEHIGIGCKWTLAHLRTHFASEKIDDFYLWQRIWSMLIITIIGECNHLSSLRYSRNCFAFLGYDVLINEDLTPYLLEVNLAPGLNADSDVDKSVKKPMLHDLFNLLGLPWKVRKPRKPKPKIPRPETTSASVPRSYMRPGTVDIAMSLISNKNMHRFHPGSRLRQRLIDMTAIYTQDLTGQIKKHLKKGPPAFPGAIFKPKVVSASSEDPNSNNNSFPAPPEQNKTPPVNWTDPVAICGDWVRVFPFNELSQNQSRSNLEMHMKPMVTWINGYLNEVRDLVYNHPHQSDDFYVDILKKSGRRLNTQIWFPHSPVPQSATDTDPDDANSNWESDNEIETGFSRPNSASCSLRSTSA